MKYPKNFKKDNAENIPVYQYIEELVHNYKNYLEEHYKDEEVSLIETQYLIRIKFTGQTTQKELVEQFKVSEGYAAKILRKFENKKLITRKEDPKNHRKKIVTLTPKGEKKAEKIEKQIENWEKERTKTTNPEEIKNLKNTLYKILP